MPRSSSNDFILVVLYYSAVYPPVGTARHGISVETGLNRNSRFRAVIRPVDGKRTLS